MSADAYRLGVDFGTSSTVAVLSRPGVPAEPVLFDGSPLLPSAVCADASGALLAGRDALQAALATPERFEPHPKRRIDEGTVFLGADVPVVDLLAAVFARVAADVRQIAGGLPGRTVVTCPASWGPARRQVLSAAASSAGLTGVALVSEPVAAAAYLLAVAGERVPEGAPVLVYDLGAGTFDATLVVPRTSGFDVLATRGLDDAGGLDIDAAVVAALDPGGSPEWRRLREPATAGERRAARQLWDGVRLAKESLGRLSSTFLHVPLVDTEVPLGREQLDELARPVVERTVEAARAVLDGQGVRAGDLGAVLLVGGGSRLPLVATVLRRAFGVDPVIIEQPELIVAKGAVLAVGEPDPEVPAPPALAPTVDVSAPPLAPTEVVTARRRRLVLVGAVAAAVVAAGGAFAWWSATDRDTPGALPTPSTSASSPSPTPSASASGTSVSPTPTSAPTKPAAYDERTTALGWLDMTLDGTIRAGYCTAFDSADGRRYEIKGADPEVSVPSGVTRVWIAGFVDPEGTGCGGREPLWVTEIRRL
ncbi:Hsp70 family protein [Phytohabitans kaempferiae]|uniref:Hsp70 family protein n=1 Tax=Phytohabitans kaempferiae TaxID=1620943 RepID=A0ABV6LUK1_9ACTN